MLNQEWARATPSATSTPEGMSHASAEQPELELIVVDDGSQDDSLQILAGIDDSRLRVIAQENQGAHTAINRGLREASADTLAILNSDDEYHPQRLQKALAALQTVTGQRPGLVASYIEIIDVEGKTTGIKHGFQDQVPWVLEKPERSFRAGNDLAEALLTENYLGTSSNFVFSRGCYQEVGEFLPLRYMHDWDFALRLARIAPLCLLPEPLLRYRVHPQNTIRQDQPAMIFELCWNLAVHLPGAAAGGQQTEANFLDRLLHSVHTYDCERV